MHFLSFIATTETVMLKDNKPIEYLKLNNKDHLVNRKNREQWEKKQKDGRF